MFMNEGVEETKPRDAGPAPSAPTIGPLMNISQAAGSTQPEQGQQMPASGDTTSDAGSSQQTLFVPRQQETSAPQAVDDVPVFDAGSARVDLMTRL